MEDPALRHPFHSRLLVAAGMLAADLAACVAGAGAAEFVHMSGTVLDSAGGPLAGAAVSINDDGGRSFVGHVDGPLFVEIGRDGYRMVFQTCDITNGQSASDSFRLGTLVPGMSYETYTLTCHVDPDTTGRYVVKPA